MVCGTSSRIATTHWQARRFRWCRYQIGSLDVSTEVWFRNPDLYVKELVECGVGRIAWDRGYLVKKRIDPSKHASLYFGQAIPWELLLVGEQGTAHLDAEHDITKPLAVYPTWQYGDDAGILEEIISSPVGLNPDHCMDMSVSIDERPVFGQDHRVVVTEIPSVQTGPGRRFAKFLKELQEDHPNCKIHVHGLYSYQVAFGFGFGAADMEVRSLAAKGRVMVPAGREMKYEQVAKNPQWCTVLGFKPVELAIPRNRCMYNIKSALWAGDNYVKLYKFKTTGDAPVDTTTPDGDYNPPETGRYLSMGSKPKEGDQFLCDTCSLNTECKYSRAGAVCSVPGAEPTSLANYFKSRDSGMIIEGLGTLLAAQTKRAERGMLEEEEFGEISSEVTKMLNQVFTNATKLAQLVDPNLRGGARVQVNVGQGGQASVNTGTPQQYISAVVRELEGRGIRREDITPQMIEGLLSSMADPTASRRAIDAKVIEHGEERSA